MKAEPGHWSHEPTCPSCGEWKLEPLPYGGYRCPGCRALCYKESDSDGKERWKIDRVYFQI